MQCQKFGCENEISDPTRYHCCSAEHGVIVKLNRQQLQECFSANESMKAWGCRELYTVEMAEYYS